MGIGALADALGLGGGGAPDPNLPPVTKSVIEVGGKKLDEAIEKLLVSVTVVDRLRMPDAFVIVFRDEAHTVLDTAGFKVGAKIKIQTAMPGGDETKDLISGEVTSIEAEYDLLGARAVVRGYDFMHRLSAGRKTKTWTNVTYADVVQEIVSAAHLDAEMDSSGGTLDHVIQGNVSDLDFLYQVAQRVGFDITIEDKTLHFKKPTLASTAPKAPGDADVDKPTQLRWGKRLLEFRARMSAVAQVTDVKVRGWNVEDRKAVIGEAKAETESTKLKMSPADLAKAVGGESLIVVDRPVGEQGAAGDMAKAIADQVASSAYEATAIAIGSPELKAGVAVPVSNVDPQLAGNWVISSARHEFGSGAYRTHLEFSGRQDRSLHGLVSGGLSVPAARSHIPGVVIAVVTKNDDPDKLGRVKVKYPWMDDKAESFWARIARPAAGKDAGFLWIPDIDEEVVVGFEQGDLAYPLILGSLWNGQAKMPSSLMSHIDNGKVQVHGIVSPAGHKIMFYDESGDAGIMLITADENVIVKLGQGAKELSISCGSAIKIKATGDLEMKADGSIKIDAAKGLDVTTKGKLTLKGQQVGIN
jgi:phage protein D/phage baseplate assembly protein gpV